MISVVKLGSETHRNSLRNLLQIDFQNPLTVPPDIFVDDESFYKSTTSFLPQGAVFPPRTYS